MESEDSPPGAASMTAHIPERVFALITTAVSTLLQIVLLYAMKYIFVMDFVCSCQLHTFISVNGVQYLLVPPLILTWVSTTIETFRSRSNNSWQRRCQCQTSICQQWSKLVTSYFILTSVWTISVLIDGDWFFCLKTNRNSSQVGMPCKTKLNQDEILTRAAYKATSLTCGFGTISVLILAWIVYEVFSVEKKLLRICKCCCTPRYQVLYNELVEEQVHSCLIDKLTEVATKRAELICEHSLTAIREDHKSLTSEEEKIKKVWSQISATDFYLREFQAPDVAPNKALNEAPNEALNEAPNEAPNEALNEAPNEALNEALNEAPNEASSGGDELC